MGSNRRYPAPSRREERGPEQDVAPRPRARHVWVCRHRELAEPWPGLVIEWRRRGELWVARVVYVPGTTDDAMLVEAWIEARHLRPAETAPP